MRVDTLFLDVGGVLVHPNWTLVAEVLARHGIAADPAAMAAAEPSVRWEIDTAPGFEASTDASRGAAYFMGVFARAGVLFGPDFETARAELADYHAVHNLWDQVPDDVAPALERLVASGRRLAVVSNSNGTVRMKLERLGLARFFETIVDSREEGVEKPDPRIFRIALDRMGADPTTTLHIGDFFNIDVTGARAARLRGVLLDPHGLYGDYDCERVASLAALVALVDAQA